MKLVDNEAAAPKKRRRSRETSRLRTPPLGRVLEIEVQKSIGHVTHGLDSPYFMSKTPDPFEL